MLLYTLGLYSAIALSLLYIVIGLQSPLFYVAPFLRLVYHTDYSSVKKYFFSIQY